MTNPRSERLVMRPDPDTAATVSAADEAAAEAAWQAWRMSQGVMPGDWRVLGYEAKEDWRAAVRAIRPRIVAEARAAERHRILGAYWEPPFPRRPGQRTHEWRLLAVLNALTEDSPISRRFTDADLLDGATDDNG